MVTVSDELKRKGRRLLFADGGWWEYSKGAWFPWQAKNEDGMHTMLLRLASAQEFPYSTHKSATWITMQAFFGSEEPVKFDAVPAIVGRNQTYFLDDGGSLEDHSPEHYLTRRVDVAIDPSAECPEWLLMMDRIFEDRTEEAKRETINFLQEWMGVAIVGTADVGRDLKKALMLWGDRATGKSAISDVLIELLGGLDRVASPSIDELCMRFGMESVIGKSAIVTSEAASPRTKADANRLKNLVTGDPMNVDRKGRPVITYRFIGPIMFTTNNLPKLEDETDALYDRVVVLECTRQFTKEDAKELDGMKPVAFLKKKGEYPGILNWALDGYDRARERMHFILPPETQSAGERFRRQNDRVYDFVQSFCTPSKKHACSSKGLAFACVQYADEEHSTKISVNTAERSIARVMRSVVVGAKHGQGYHEKQQFKAWHGLKLNDAGMRFFEAAGHKGYAGFKEISRRMNYSIA